MSEDAQHEESDGVGEPAAREAARAPTRAQVEASLRRVLEGEHVPAGSQMAAFLEHVVTETLDGREADIKAYTIAVDALGRDEDFDPQSNAAVRVLAGRLRKSLALHNAAERERFEASTKPRELTRITLPTGTYVPVLERVARAGAAAEDPIIEGDDESVDEPATVASGTAPGDAGLPEPEPAPSHAPTPAPMRSRLFGRDGIERSHMRVAGLLLAGLVFVVAGAFVAGNLMAQWRVEQRQERRADLHRLPSITVSVSAESTYPKWFDTNEFTRAVDTVVGRFDDYTYLGTHPARPAPGMVLPGGDYHLSLTAIPNGRRVRLYGSIVRMKDRVTVWSGRFLMTRPRPKRSDTLERVGRMISPLLAPYGALYSDLLRRNDTRPSLRCLLLGYRYFNNETSDLHAAARDCSEKLIEEGSRLPTIHALLTFLYLDEHRSGRNRRARDPLRAARMTAMQAVEYGAGSARAHQAIFAVTKVDRQYRAARLAGRQAVDLNPYDADIAGDFAAFLVMTGDIRPARRLMDDIKGLWVAKPAWYAFYEFLAAELDGARTEAIVLARKLDPRRSPLAAIGAAIGAKARGDVDEATFALGELEAHEPGFADDPVGHLQARGFRYDVATDVAKRLWQAGLELPMGDIDLGGVEAPLW